MQVISCALSIQEKYGVWTTSVGVKLKVKLGNVMWKANFLLSLYMHVPFSLYPAQRRWLRVYWIHLDCPSVRPSICRRHGFGSVTQVRFRMSISNCPCMLFVAMSRSILIFSEVTFKMATWQSYWIFLFPCSNFSLALHIKSKLHWHITCVHGKKPIDFQYCYFQNGRLADILDFSVSGICRWHGFRSVTRLFVGYSISNFICILFVAMGQSLLIFRDFTFGHIGFFSFRTLTLIWLWISSPSFSSTLLECMQRSLLIFSNVTVKLAAWQPYWIFPFLDSYFSLALNIKSKLQ